MFRFLDWLWRPSLAPTQERVLEEAMQRLGFAYDEPTEGAYGVFHGVHDGVDVALQLFDVRVSRHRTVQHLEFRFRFDRLPLRFRLTRPGFDLSMQRRSEATDVAFGDPRFDRNVVARGRPEQLREFLDEGRRRAVLRFFGYFDEPEVRRDRCRGSTEHPRSAETIVRSVEVGTSLANELLY